MAVGALPRRKIFTDGLFECVSPHLRYLQTSIARTIEKGDPTADSLGYLFPVCQPADDMADDGMEMVPLVVRRAPSRSPNRESTPTSALEQAVVYYVDAGVSELSASTDEDGSGTYGVPALCNRVLTPTKYRACVHQLSSGGPSSSSSAVSIM